MLFAVLLYTVVEA